MPTNKSLTSRQLAAAGRPGQQSDRPAFVEHDLTQMHLTCIRTTNVVVLVQYISLLPWDQTTSASKKRPNLQEVMPSGGPMSWLESQGA